MIFRHYKAPHFAETLHMFMGTELHGSNLITEFDAFVLKFNMQAEREWFFGGMQLTAYTTDSNVATLFKLAFCGAA